MNFCDTFQEIQKSVVDYRHQALDEFLKKRLIELLGSMPSNEEIKQHAKRVTFATTGDVEWYWDNTLLLREKFDFNY